MHHELERLQIKPSSDSDLVSDLRQNLTKLSKQEKKIGSKLKQISKQKAPKPMTGKYLPNTKNVRSHTVGRPESPEVRARREKIISLRKEGKSIREIVKIVGTAKTNVIRDLKATR